MTKIWFLPVRLLTKAIFEPSVHQALHPDLSTLTLCRMGEHDPFPVRREVGACDVLLRHDDLVARTVRVDHVQGIGPLAGVENPLARRVEAGSVSNGPAQ